MQRYKIIVSYGLPFIAFLEKRIMNYELFCTFDFVEGTFSRK